MSLVQNFTFPRIFLRNIKINTSANNIQYGAGNNTNELIDEIKFILKENSNSIDGMIAYTLQSKLNDLEFINKYS